MLSKVKHFNNVNHTFNKADTTNLVSALIKELENNNEKIRLIEANAGGTLGIFFIAEINGNKKFVKTHLNGEEYRNNLIKEINILSVVYGDKLKIDRKDIECQGRIQTFLIMDYLDKPSVLIDINIVENCIQYCNNKLANYSDNDRIINYTFDNVIEEGKKSVKLLFEANKISDDVKKKCEDAINIIEGKKSYYKPIISHGDLSNVNVLEHNGELIVIDWEDALWAFDQYDFLYWLTFYSQRKYYSTNVFKSRNIDENWGKCVMALIVLVKSALSYKRNSYLNNSISFEERLNEIFQISE